MNVTELSTYGKDTPLGRPDVDGLAGIFVPTAAFDVDNGNSVKWGAAIVGFGNTDGSLTVYFEANRFDDSSLHKWENKARKAYERMVMGAPTVSKAKIDAQMMDQVGTIDGSGIRVQFPERLHAWLLHSKALDTAPEGDNIFWRTR
ncbi:MAG: hypothetical protein V4754_04355 [Pseudomonadota bacterium]